MVQPVQTNSVLQKALLIPKILLGFLSTAIFFVAFVLIGDVLIAAFSAIAVAVTQFVLGKSARTTPGLSVMASLFVVLALTGLSLAGDDPVSAWDAIQVNASQSSCHCQTPATPAHVTPIPLHEAPQGLASKPGRV